MPTPMNDSGDLEKLKDALSSVLSSVSSSDDLLAAFGSGRHASGTKIWHPIRRPRLHLHLLVIGGSFKRMADQTSGEATVPDAVPLTMQGELEERAFNQWMSAA